MTLLPLSMALAIGVVNAASAKTPLANLINATQTNGKTNTHGDIGEKFLDLKGLKLKVTAVDRVETLDDLKHTFDVASDSGAARWLVFSTYEKEKAKFTTYLFESTLDGQLQKAVRAVGEFDSEGKPIPTSGKFSQLDPKAKETGKLYKHELDFWLKGKFRKTPGKKPAGNK